MSEVNGKIQSWRELERKSETIKKAEVLKIPLEEIHVKEGFNPRDSSKPETREKINAIKESFKAGRYVPPIECSLEDGVVYIVDGHGRYEAAVQANEELIAEGNDLRIDSLVVVPFRGNDAQRLVLTVTANEGEKLTPVEAAEVVSRLLNMGWDRAKITDTFTWSQAWFDKLSFIATFPEKLKRMVLEGKISTDVAVEQFKKKKDKAVEYLEEKLAGAEDGKKLTSKHVRERVPVEKDEKFLNKVLGQAREVVGGIIIDKESYPNGIEDSDDYEILVDGVTLKALLKMKDTLNKREQDAEPVQQG